MGSHVVTELLERGHVVRTMDNFSTGRRGNLAAGDGDVETFEGDVRSYEGSHNAVEGCDSVIHLAASPSVPRSVQDPLTRSAVNVTSTLNTLLAARGAPARRVALASPSSIYGFNETTPKHEDVAPEPISPYVVSKLAAEQYARALGSLRLETVSLRRFNMYHPHHVSTPTAT